MIGDAGGKETGRKSQKNRKLTNILKNSKVQDIGSL